MFAVSNRCPVRQLLPDSMSLYHQIVCIGKPCLPNPRYILLIHQLNDLIPDSQEIIQDFRDAFE